MTDGVLTTRQAAERLHCSLKTVHRMATDGRLNPRDKWPGYRGAYLFDEQEVDKLAATAVPSSRYPKERERAS